MRLYLARHGESIANVNWPDYASPAEMNGSLTERGQKQAQALADWMKRYAYKPDLIYASTMRRTRETAQFVADAYGMDVIHTDLLREGSTSFWDHRPVPDEELETLGDVDFHTEPFLPFSSNAPDMESYAHLLVRVGKFLSEKLIEHTGQTVLVVAHGWVKNAFFDVINNVGPYRRCNSYLEYTALSHFEYLDEKESLGPWRMYYINQSEHLTLAGLEKSLEG